jgi:small-conductance mechanosensitive channel
LNIPGIPEHVLELTVLGNAVRAYLLAVGFVLGIVVVLKVYALILGRRLRPIAARSETLADDLALDLIDRAATPLLVASGFYVLCDTLNTPPGVRKIAHVILVVLGSYYLVTSAVRVLEHWAQKSLKPGNGKQASDPQAVEHLRVMGRIVAWVVGALLVLTNLGYDVTSLLAGLGVAGIAVGLAVQNILRDLFSYVCILVDKPFKIGDFVIVQSDPGTVESIGIRSTRVRTLEGDELVVPNADLTSSRVHNYGRLSRRRAVCKFGVTYNTPPEKLERIPALVREILGALEKARFDRCSFREFGASSLDFETVYFVESADYLDFVRIQEGLNLGIVRRFRAAGIEFAFPTQTLYLQKAAASVPAAEWEAMRTAIDADPVSEPGRESRQGGGDE